MIDNLMEVANGNFVALDVEGDGNNPPHPVEICTISYAGGKVSDTRHWLVNPGRPMTDFVQKLHGITDAMLMDAPAFPVIEEDVRAALTDKTIVVHGAREDLTMLRTAMPDADSLPQAVIDVQRLARAVMPGLERYRLEAVCDALGIAPQVGEGRSGYHTAAADAEMAGQAFMKLAALAPSASQKQRSHYASMALVRMSPQRETRLREEIAARTANGGRFGP